MKKLKERLKRGLAMMMAAASIVSVFPSMNVSAASETAKITFAYCHDGAGNTIKYQQTVTHDGRVCGEAGDARTRIYADGEPAFCIQPGVSLHTGNTLRANASDTWNALSGSQRNAVNLALLYGSQGSMGSLSGSEDEKVVATQMVIWEIVTGCRNANAPYNQTDSKFYNSICANGANGGVSAAYSQIVAGMEDKVTKYYPMEIKRQSQWIVEYRQDIEQVKAHTPPDRDTFPPMQINGVTYGEKKEAGQAIIAACKAMTSPDPVPLGAYRGLAMELSYSTFSKEFVITLQGKRAYHVTLGTDIHGNITRLDNEIEKFGDNLSRCEERLETLKAQLENAKIEAVKEFPKEQELAEKTARLGELNALLDMDKKENIVLDCEPEEEETESEKGNKDRER